MSINISSILCSNASAPVAQLIRASDQYLENPGSKPVISSSANVTMMSAILYNTYVLSIEANIETKMPL